MPEGTDINFFQYRGKPLVRKGNTIYYGNPQDELVLLLQILSSKKVGDVDVADRIIVQLVKTDPDLSIREKIVHKVEKRGLYSAMHIGCFWLDKALGE